MIKMNVELAQDVLSQGRLPDDNPILKNVSNNSKIHRSETSRRREELSITYNETLKL